jgi:hypothetical protein
MDTHKVQQLTIHEERVMHAAAPTGVDLHFMMGLAASDRSTT